MPQAAQPVAKLRWLARTEPEAARRTAGVLQAHDWLVWQLLGRPRGGPRTAEAPRARATGRRPPRRTGPTWSSSRSGTSVALPEVLGPAEAAGMTPEGLLISAGTGETMAAALGLGLGIGDAVVSLGASGSVMAVHHEALADPAGLITSLADAAGTHLPVVHTANAVRVLRGTAEMLGLEGLEELSALALKSTPGASGLVLLPYLEGERTPPLPHTAGTLSGLRRESMKPEHLARAAFEGMLCSLADAMDVLRGRGVEVRRVFLLGAAAELPAVQAVAPAVFGAQVVVPQPADYAALGAARQAAGRWAWRRARCRPRRPPAWQGAAAQVFEPGDDGPVGQAVRQQYAATRDQIHPGAFRPRRGARGGRHPRRGGRAAPVSRRTGGVGIRRTGGARVTAVGRPARRGWAAVQPGGTRVGAAAARGCGKGAAARARRRPRVGGGLGWAAGGICADRPCRLWKTRSSLSGVRAIVRPCSFNYSATISGRTSGPSLCWWRSSWCRHARPCTCRR